MITKLHSSILLLSCLILTNSVFCQNQNHSPSSSGQKTLLWPYSLPESEDYGPMDVMVHGTYQFTREHMGDSYRVHLKYNITRIEYSAKYGSLRFKKNGRIYRQDEMNGTDGLGSQGFSEVNLTSINIKMMAIGVQNAREFDINENWTSANYIGDISPTVDLNGLSLNLVKSYASSIYYDNTSTLSVRIDKMNALIEDRDEYKTTISKADAAFNSEDWTEAKGLYEKCSRLLPKESYPKAQIQKCIDKITAEKARKIKEEQATQTAQNSSNNGTSSGSSNSNGSGSTNSSSNSSGNNSGSSSTNSSGNSGNNSSSSSNSTEGWSDNDFSTEEEETEPIRTVPVDTGWTQADTDAFLAKNEAKRQEQEAQIKQESAAFAKSMDYTLQSYYTMQSINETKGTVQENMVLSGNYSSVEELEREYNTKFQALDESIDDMHRQEQDLNLNTVNYYSTQTTGNTQLYGTLASGALYLINEAQNKREEEWAKEQLRLQKEQAAIDIENKRIAQRQAMRSDLFNMFPEGGIPLSQHKVNTGEIYFFLYSFDESTINQSSPTIQLSNVFPIAKYSDGTWPFKSNLNSEFAKLGLSGKLTLVGFYTTQQMAEDMHNSFQRLASSSSMTIENVFYKGKPSTTSSTSPQKTSPSTTNVNKNSKDDFWGEPVKTTPTNQTTPKTTTPKQTTTKPVEDDFWGAPVKTTPAKQTTPKSTTTKPTTTKPATQKKSEDDFWGTPVKKN